MSSGTGYSKADRQTIITRDQGLCRRCTTANTADIHHRSPRGMGGSPAANTLANGVLLCRPCHEHIERYRSLARMDGWLVPRGTDPAEVPVTDVWGRRYWLTQTGEVRKIERK